MRDHVNERKIQNYITKNGNIALNLNLKNEVFAEFFAFTKAHSHK